MRSPSILALACAIIAGGCFADRLVPPTFRYSCRVDAECEAPEACLRGLCQIPCTQATFRNDCPTAGNYAACVNGVCSNICTVGADQCPQPQRCLELPIDLSALASGMGGRGAGAAADELGICGMQCEPGDDVCPEGELCLMGFCAQTCMFDAQCQEGFACAGGVCLPVDVLEGDDADATSGGSPGTTTGEDPSDGTSADDATDAVEDTTGTTSGGLR